MHLNCESVQHSFQVVHCTYFPDPACHSCACNLTQERLTSHLDGQYITVEQVDPFISELSRLEELRQVRRIILIPSESVSPLSVRSALSSAFHNIYAEGYPNDYWRFTPEGFKSLLKPFEFSFVGSCGGVKDFPQTVVGLGFKSRSPDLEVFEQHYLKWAHFNNKVDEQLLPSEKLQFD